MKIGDDVKFKSPVITGKIIDVKGDPETKTWQCLVEYDDPTDDEGIISRWFNEEQLEQTNGK
jgi:hypothetical protein